MGCFLGCFKVPKDPKRRRRSPKKSLLIDHRVEEWCKPLLPSLSPNQISPKPLTQDLSPAAEVIAAVAPPELKENVEQGIVSNARKKVTFDLNVTTYEAIAAVDDPDFGSEEEEGTEENDEERKVEEEQDESSPNLRTFPVNHRYQNCESSDDEGGSESGEDDEYDSDFDEEEEEEVGIEGNEEESYGSFFALPIDKVTQSLPEVNSPKPKFIPSHAQDNPPTLAAGGTIARDRSQFVQPLLNPVENLSQWKEVKVRTAPVKNLKENIFPEQENNEMAFTAKTPGPISSAKQEVSVDASLSTWLPSLDNSTAAGTFTGNSPGSYSSFSREERPILGALTIEDIKESSVTSSPRKSPYRILPADEIPILGTVGRYWNCRNQADDSATSRRLGGEMKGIPNTTSKYREDKAVNWHTTPFEVRLERALKDGVA